MFYELNKYKDNDYFHFKESNRLRNVCNTPRNKSGIYFVYELKGSEQELIYIGISGKKLDDGSMFIRAGKLGGMKDRIVNGQQFEKDARKRTWPKQMRQEGIEMLKIHWYVTHGADYIDCPRSIEKKLLRDYYNKFGRLPRWNKSF